MLRQRLRADGCRSATTILLRRGSPPGTDLAAQSGNNKLQGADEMLKALKVPSARQVAKWCAYGLVLAAPGSLVVLPLWLLGRHWATRAAWNARPPRSEE
jgi:hypothetical protein